MTSIQNDIVLSTENLSIGYPEHGTPVLSNLNLSLRKGTLVSFMGPNGIGKTTLLRTLAGLMNPLDGKIWIRNKEIKNYSLNQLAKIIGVVLTDPIQAGSLSVTDLVSMGRYPYTNWFLNFSESDIEKVEQAIYSVQLEGLRNRKINELSDGQMQKVLIARALAQDGEIMILDEPNSHLDLNNRIEIMRILRRMCRQTGKTILVATHELDLALQTSDWLWLATRAGKIIDGIPEDLVLNNAFDEVFDTKGFDLKTGRVIHEGEQLAEVTLQGTGFMYLWTKNALERTGIQIAESSEIRITINEDLQKWTIQLPQGTKEVNSISELIESILSGN
jgi:iron complex transport system ATP-binding protein